MRIWLEPASTGVDSYVRVDSDLDKHGHDISLKVADCNRSLYLIFNVYGPRDRAKMRRKVAKLREAVELIEALIEEDLPE